MRVVRASLCRLLSGTELGGAAAVCKLMGWSDSIKSYDAILCRVTPVYMWIKRCLQERSSHSEGHGTINGSSDEPSSDSGSEDDVIVSARHGCLHVATTAPQDYIHRCSADDITHPLHGMCKPDVLKAGEQ